MADGKNAAVVIGYQPDGVAGIVDIEDYRILLGIHIDPRLFPADGHILRGGKVQVGPVFDALLGKARLVAVIQRDAVMPRGQRHGRRLHDRFAVGHLGDAAAAVLVIADLGMLRDHLPLIRRKLVDRGRLRGRPDGPQHDQKLQHRPDQDRRAAQKL
ncbi:MAG: hypothetical protein ACLTNY_09515 [Blautia massiliensis (ex Durand et al. 2017)]